ncbi:MAG: hypothetical protein MJ137_05895 [Clostridia bacterium]|nr:hypothetical protein [Clostridia bacterium]
MSASTQKKEKKKSALSGIKDFFGRLDASGTLSGILAFISVVLCLVPAFVYSECFVDHDAHIAYPLESNPSSYQPYIQQFDAFEKGQAELDVRVSGQLLECKNPYDPNERAESHAWYMWDRAMYNGKYYSYFGIAPLLTVYYPHYLLNGTLPSDSEVMSVFLFMAAIFMPLCVWLWAFAFSPKLPKLLLLFAAPSCFWATMITLIARGRTPFYYIASVAACAFLTAFLFFALLAYNCKKRWAVYLNLALAGISFGLCFQSRINTAFCAAIVVVPALWFLIIARERKAKKKARAAETVFELAALGLPVMLFFTGSMIFNAMRFSGPLDFGTDYQLTVADVSTYKMHGSWIIPSVYHYIIAPLSDGEAWPYLNFNYTYFTDYGTYIYRDASMGLLNIPLMFSLFLAPAVWFSEKYSVRRKVMTLSAVIAILVTAWINTCLGGIIYRYTCDMTVIAAFFSAIILLSVCETVLKSSKRAGKILVITAAFLLMIISVYVCIRISLLNGNGNVISYDDETAEKFAKFLFFRK